MEASSMLNLLQAVFSVEVPLFLTVPMFFQKLYPTLYREYQCWRRVDIQLFEIQKGIWKSDHH